MGVPAIIRGSVIGWDPGRVASAAGERAHNLDIVARRKGSGGPFRSAHDRTIDGDGEKAHRRVDTASDEQLRDCRHRDLFFYAIDPHPRHRASAAATGFDFSTA